MVIGRVSGECVYVLKILVLLSSCANGYIDVHISIQSGAGASYDSAGVMKKLDDVLQCCKCYAPKTLGLLGSCAGGYINIYKYMQSGAGAWDDIAGLEKMLDDVQQCCKCL